MNLVLSLPSFEKGEDFKELSPLDGSYVYRFVTIREIKLYMVHPILPKNQELIFLDKKGRIWLRIKNNEIIISKDYAWDGCTPKKWWGGWWGTPDFKKTHLASLVHDALLQFHQTDHFPLSRYQIDNIFKNILYIKKFILADLYYTGVRIGSQISTKKNNNVYSELTTIPKH